MEDYYKLLGKIRSKEDFLYFMKDVKDMSVQDYLESVVSWVEDMEGYYKNTNQEMPQDINWNFIAVLFYVGSIYE